MEQQISLFALNMVEEVELIYKTKVKPSERPANGCYELLKLPYPFQFTLLYQVINGRFGDLKKRTDFLNFI